MWYPGQAQRNNCLYVRSQCSPFPSAPWVPPLMVLGQEDFHSFPQVPELLDSQNNGRQSQLYNGGCSLPRILRTAGKDLKRIRTSSRVVARLSWAAPVGVCIAPPGGQSTSQWWPNGLYPSLAVFPALGSTDPKGIVVPGHRPGEWGGFLLSEPPVPITLCQRVMRPQCPSVIVPSRRGLLNGKNRSPGPLLGLKATKSS